MDDNRSILSGEVVPCDEGEKKFSGESVSPYLLTIKQFQEREPFAYTMLMLSILLGSAFLVIDGVSAGLAVAAAQGTHLGRMPESGPPPVARREEEVQVDVKGPEETISSVMEKVDLEGHVEGPPSVAVDPVWFEQIRAPDEPILEEEVQDPSVGWDECKIVRTPGEGRAQRGEGDWKGHYDTDVDMWRTDQNEHGFTRLEVFRVSGRPDRGTKCDVTAFSGCSIRCGAGVRGDWALGLDHSGYDPGETGMQRSREEVYLLPVCSDGMEDHDGSQLVYGNLSGLNYFGVVQRQKGVADAPRLLTKVPRHSTRTAVPVTHLSYFCLKCAYAGLGVAFILSRLFDWSVEVMEQIPGEHVFPVFEASYALSTVLDGVMEMCLGIVVVLIGALVHAWWFIQ